MTEFLTDLFNSIFIPGPTSTLVAATNATFAALQVVLLTLLIATYSIHFLILSFLCAGLWASINWFVKELAEAKAKQANDKGEKRRLEEREEGEKGGKGPDIAEVDVGDTDGSGTETEDMGESEASLKPRRREIGASGLAPPSTESSVLTKRRSLGEVSGGELSTDSEWDKVENEGDGDE